MSTPATPDSPVDSPAPAPRTPLWPAFLGLLLFAVGGALPGVYALVTVMFTSANSSTLTDPAMLEDAVMETVTSPAYLAASLVLSWVGLLTPIFVSATRRGRDWKRIFRWGFKPSRDIPLAIGVVVALRLVEAGVSFFLTEVIGVNPDELGNASWLTGPTGAWLVVLVLCAVIGAPVVEELFFRGYALTATQARWGLWPGILSTSLVFGILHAQGSAVGALFLFAGTALTGFTLAVLVTKTGRIGSSITAHILFNASGVALALLLAGTPA